MEEGVDEIEGKADRNGAAEDEIEHGRQLRAAQRA